MKVLHLGCKHKSNDSRIWVRECKALADAGYGVVFYTLEQHDTSSKEMDSIKNRATIKYHNLNVKGVELNRDILGSIIARGKNKQKIIKIIESEKVNIVHIHEFELIYILKAIRKKYPNIKVIYDIHENTSDVYYTAFQTIVGNSLGKVLAKWIDRYEVYYVRRMDGIVTVVPTMTEKFKRYNDNIVEVRNVPQDISIAGKKIEDRENIVCYSGGLTEIRGTTRLCAMAGQIEGELILAGMIKKEYLEYLEGRFDLYHENIKFVGYLGRKEINQIYSQAVVGLCILPFSRNAYNSYPIKVFEYMAAGIPVICSNFPLWRKIVEKNNCGIVVDPNNDDEVISAINRLLNDRNLSKELGRNGRMAIEQEYNWEKEKIKLLNFYHNI